MVKMSLAVLTHCQLFLETVQSAAPPQTWKATFKKKMRGTKRGVRLDQGAWLFPKYCTNEQNRKKYV